MPTTTTMDDYERRFQRSLQKLTIPSWYADTNPSSNMSNTTSKQSIISTELTPWKNRSRESEQTPEMLHTRRPQSYRSCRSSIATSPSPSIHSWHPNHMMDGMNLSLAIPSSTRRYHKYQKGIERVSKSSRWYQPTQFVVNEPTKDQTGIIKIPASPKNNHYDTPKIRNQDENIVSKSNDSMEKSIINDKQEDNPIKSNESQIMPLAKKDLFSQIELVEIIDEDDDKKIDDNNLLERNANDLIETVLTDILSLKNLSNQDDDDDNGHDQNSGVRELSEDENGLRELDENDMNNTDEFIVFATNPDLSNNDLTSNSPRSTSNKLYTFSKSNEHQNLTKSILEKNLEQPFEKFFYTSPIYHPNSFNHQLSSDEVNEETARIGRLLLDSIPILRAHNPISNRLIISKHEYDEELNDRVRRDSAYSSNQERINIPQTIYEALSECYSGYSFIPSDFLTLNISTTDEAYESEPTTMCSSIATTTHVHPDLEHEFEYPSPPPPVPDRRFKPTYLKPSPPPTKPRLSKQNNIDLVEYSIIQKTKPLPRSTIQQFLTSASNNDSTSPSTRTMSSRHYCGSNEETKSPIKIKEKRNHRTLNCLHPSTTDDNQKRNLITKSSSSSLNKTKVKKQQKLVTDFDEATNGLAIRLPAPVSNKQNSNRTSTPLSTKRTNVKSNRPTLYETSV